ncbi:MAG: bifunctional 23S rRNA (guanine(2069)-N(7))-methyltransferase RlmK/23S rRNA (guanine(2445)-N(2))-methyltransferase RlmL [Planctomycetaceae bacterium]|nr:bifunctional 23S rRNA (guanine(2069)-N(7))-methyltransferase RlmK/23S rRNA (guanine(2445)-N(2))-methyltransferase RlmL [Planctomycetales bacterium]MCB9923707.1 bifunctional 23S rRNA (guanine(2069)-N(7))-methyltransferase RlmK/23S rRNA (guanine(2445)-N(2))-methyltransferase RlmL [Planctomycetaceae bacterium]
MNQQFDFIATTAFGLEAVVKRELAALGYEAKVGGPGRIHFVGDLSAICRTNLWLRTADRVLVNVATFEATDFDALFDTTKALPWANWIPKDGQFPVAGRSLKSQLSSVPACQRTVKKAIVESLRAAYGIETLPETGTTFKVEIALLNDQATLTIDTTGPSLHKRGYRLQAAEAPLKETLAAALIQLSFWNSERPFLDPFCGSGTLPIEAAMIGRNIAPGIARSFPAESWPQIESAAWNYARQEAKDLMRPPFEERLVGTDIDQSALYAARQNAERAGVSDQIHFQRRDFASLASQRKYGCLVTNPPYGERLGEQWEWRELYESIPRVLRTLPTWSHFIITSYPDFELLIQRQAERRRKLYNGRIECTYYQFHGPRPGSNRDSEPQNNTDATTIDSTGELKPLRPPRVNVMPVFGGITEKGREQAELFRSRLKKRARHLRRWPTKQGITCFRIYERDIPEIPLIVDRYEDHLHITEYERPHERDLGQHADWLDLMVRTASETLEVAADRVFFKRRERQRGAKQHEHLAGRQYEIKVSEGGLQFIVNLSDYVDTGLFLDHRIARSMVRDESQGANFLNLFAYTGAFTVYAASGGAAKTTTVDWTRSYLDWAQRNMAANGFQGPQHQFVRSDAREFLRAPSLKDEYTLAVVDPPTFSNSKRTEEDWDVQRDHVDLLNAVIRHMAPGGVIYFSTNFRRFKLDEAHFSDLEVREISRRTVPEDFRNKRIHRCWRMTCPG